MGANKSKKILIVDDDHTIVELLSRVLGREGYQICTAFDGEEALFQLGAEHPDMILLDLNLPKLPGEEVCKQVRANEKTKDLPVIMITAKISESEKIIGKVIGANHYITKPFNINDLISIVDDTFSLFN